MLHAKYLKRETFLCLKRISDYLQIIIIIISIFIFLIIFFFFITWNTLHLEIVKPMDSFHLFPFEPNYQQFVTYKRRNITKIAFYNQNRKLLLT